MAGFSDGMENKVLEHIVGKTTLTITAPIYLALTTSAVADSDTLTNAAAKEATYTGYARKSVAAADWNAAASGSITTANSLTFAACTGGSSTVIGWFLTTASSGTSGDVIMYGTATSTVISTTQTPATIAAGGLSLSLD